MTIQLDAGPACHQRLEMGFAFDELQPRNVLAVKVQEIEGVIDEPHIALAVGRRLSTGKAR
jgi:hypothetical protein